MTNDEQPEIDSEVIIPREPTEEMLIAARDWSAKFVGYPIGNKAATGCWQAMFDAIPCRRAIDATDEFRRAQPASDVADDVAKIVEAMRAMHLRADNYASHDFLCADIATRADEAINLAESLARKIEALEREREEFRSCLATTIGKLMVAEAQIASRDAEVGRLAEELRQIERIAALMRGETGAAKREPSAEAISQAAEELWEGNFSQSDPDEIWEEQRDSTKDLYHREAKRLLSRAYSIDRAPRLATAFEDGMVSTFEQRAKDLASVEKRSYARGVEDAAKECEGNFDSEMQSYGHHFAERIRTLLPKEPATEDAREKEKG